MIDWHILNYLNKQKYKKCLLIVDNIDSIKKYVSNPQIDIVETEKFLDLDIKNSYHIISTWTALSVGPSINIYSYLAKMNHILKDDGKIFVRALQNESHLTELTYQPFCWNIERIKSIGKTKNLKLKNKIEIVKNSHASFIRFIYIPAL